MAKAFSELGSNSEAGTLSHPEWLGLLLDRETSLRHDKRLAARLRVAKLRQQTCVEDVDYRSPRGLDRALFQKLVQGEWITAHDNLALIGPDPELLASAGRERPGRRHLRGGQCAPGSQRPAAQAQQHR